MNLQSQRMVYRPIDPADLGDVYRLLTDGYVRRYLMDGDVVEKSWVLQAIHSSLDLFARRGVGLWLARTRGTQKLVGLGGFHVVANSFTDEPQLIYALYEEYAGRGLGTEIARTVIDYAIDERGFEKVLADADAPNVASTSILRKLGFQQFDSGPGAFGEIHMFEFVPDD